MASGLARAGYAGALAARAGFTLPSAIALVLFALGLAEPWQRHARRAAPWPKVVAVAVVAQAVWGMAQPSTDVTRVTIMAATVRVVLTRAIGLGPGRRHRRSQVPECCSSNRGRSPTIRFPITVRHFRRAGLITLFLACCLASRRWSALPSQALAMADAFYRAGSLVFGGGRGVLPVAGRGQAFRGWVSNESFSGRLPKRGASGPRPSFLRGFPRRVDGMQPYTAGVGRLLCLLAIFPLSFLLVVGALPFGERLHGKAAELRRRWRGSNAAVVGLLPRFTIRSDQRHTNRRTSAWRYWRWSP